MSRLHLGDRPVNGAAGKPRARRRRKPDQQLYAAMVAAVRAWAATIDPADHGPGFLFSTGGGVNLVEVAAYCPRGGGTTLAQFHADPDNDGPHDECDGDGTAQHCPHCRGDRRAEGGGR
jgi:hypothetical protein